MSGGSYNYLYCAEADTIINRISDIEAMRDALVRYDAKDFAVLTQDLLLVLKQQQDLRESYLNKLSAVWRAVEYKDSMDIGIEELQAAFKKAREK